MTPEVDPLTLEIVRHSLVAIADEAEMNLTRTAFSAMIREMKDYSVGLITAKGEIMAQCRGGVPTFVADLGSPLVDAVNMLGDDIEEGDIIINNYSGVCGQHLNNVCMYTPVMLDGKPIVFTGLRAHWDDVGGAPTTNTTEIYQEGMQFRNLKIYKRGKLDPDLGRMIQYNVRRPDIVFGDLEAQVAAVQLMKSRLEELIARYGWEQIHTAMRKCWEQSEQYVRRKIREIPNGRYTAEAFMDNDGVSNVPVPIRATVIVEDEDISIDLTDMPPKVAGPYNSGLTGGALSAAKVAFKGAISPTLLPNEGEFRPLKVITKPDTIVTADAEAAMAFYSVALKSLIDVILQAFSQAMPEHISAGNNAQYAAAQVRGRSAADGRKWFGGYTTPGGWGGFKNGDGQSALLTTTHGDTKCMPVEVLETESPLRFLRQELIRDSGGAGRWRGGLGIFAEILTPEPGSVTVIFDRTKSPPHGLFGGKAAPAGYAEFRRPNTPVERLTKAPFTPIPAGTIVSTRNSGGGGYGDPLLRDLAALADDLRQGYVSAEAAVADYGAVLKSDNTLDPEATAKRRETLVRQRA